MRNPVYYAVRHKISGKFVPYIGKSKNHFPRGIRLKTNPFQANYFVERRFCQSWMDEKELPSDIYEVVAFTQDIEKLIEA